MALDAGMISALTDELSKKLTGAKIEKICQPEKDEIDLILRAGGRAARLALIAAPGSPRVGLSAEARENPAVPPMFCTLLRKHLGGAVLKTVRQPGFERAIVFEFAARDEMGYETKRVIIAEMMGKYCNLIFVNGEGRILGVLRPVDFSASEKRQLLVGMYYEEPPVQEGKRDPLSESREAFLKNAETAGDRPADKFILSGYFGFSPLIAREIAWRASGAADCSSAAYAERLWDEFSRVCAAIRNKDFSPCMIRLNGENAEYSFLPIGQYGSSAEQIFFDSPSEMIEKFSSERERTLRAHRRAQDLFRLLTNAENRLTKKIEAQKKELAECAEKDRYKEWADLITANLYALKKGQEEATLVNWYSPDAETVTLRLDGRLTPAANAQKYYKRYTKAKTAERELTAQIAKAREELSYLGTVADALARAEAPSDFEEIRRELARTGYASAPKSSGSRKAPPTKCLTYCTSGGFTVLCGKNNLQNDALTFEKAGKNDWWFHVHAAPGSHVILLTDGTDDPPARDFTEAAMIAAVNSSLAKGTQVVVDYTRVRSVKKPPHAKPGFVIYHTNFSAVVRPDAEAVKKLECL